MDLEMLGNQLISSINWNCMTERMTNSSKKEQTACEKPEQFELKYFFCHILESSEFKKEFQKEFGNVKLGHDKLDEENKTIVYLQSEGAEESMEARKWICELQEDFPCTSFDYKDLNDLNPILSKSGHLIRQLMMKFIKQEDVHHETNETAQMIHIWSKSLRQAEVDKIGSNVKKSIQIKPEIISMSITDLKKHVSQSNELSSEEKEFVKIESQGDKAKLTGLAYIVDRIIKLISGGHQSYSDGGATHQQKGPTHTTAKEPAPQDMDREPSAQGADPGLNWNVEQLLDFEDHKLLVSVTNIPTDKTREDLQSELKCQSASGPRLVYQNGKREALLIFKDLKDKGQFKDKPDKYIFDRSKKRVLGNLSLAINPTVWKKLPLCTQDKLEQGLHEIGVTLIKAEGVMKAPTLYQLQVAKEVVTNMTKESTVDEVTVIVWRIVSILQRQTIAEIETNCGKKITFSEEKFQIRMPAMSKGLEDSFDTLKTAIDDMKENSIQDVPLENKEVQKAEEACKQMGEGCCIFDKKSKTVFIYANSFEDFTKYKFQFDIKIGRKKTTGRGDRSNAQVVSPDEASSENKTSQGQSENNTKRKVSSHMSSLEKNAFMTPEGIKVLVYKGSIVRLDVDCIVNAANSRLSNGGGVARAISEAAGDKFERECKHYINTNGKLPVGEACSTTAGNLDYKCVIHTVGPAWYDYSKTSQGRQKCEEDLKYAVVNSFYEADKRGMNSIALPAISSAIFAVPMKVCVKQYVRAVAVYSKRRNRTSALSEIHFVDINEETVRAIQVAFEEQYPLSSSRVGANSATYSDEFAGNKDLPEPLMFESSLHQYEFYFMGNIENNMMLLWNINIEHIKGTSAVLVPVDQYGNGGFIGKNIEAKVEYRTEYMQEKKGLFKSPQTVCNVLKNQGYGCGFIFILYAVYPQLEKNKEITVRERSLAKTIASVLNTADKDGKIQSVAIPMFGIDSKKESDIRLFSSIFVETYRQFCQEKWKNHKQNPLKVIVVCHEQKMYKEAQCVFEEYVQKLKPPELTPSDVCAATANDFQQSQKKAEMSDDLKSMDRCVICMDTVTDPKTIKCGHTFCTECIDQQFEYQKRCPTCGTPCGVITGDQPYGTMNDSVNQHKHLPGYEDYGTIYIMYNFHGGKQQDCHPNPGAWYKGIQRTAYLPNNEEGRKILKMLQIAFKRNLTFTIGNSRTTGQEGVITWNDIHHKTDHRPDTQFGYPDPTYLARVKDELAAKGVTEDDI